MSCIASFAVAPAALASPPRVAARARPRVAVRAPPRARVVRVAASADFAPEPDLELSDLTAISPIDGRYGAKVKILRACFSEYALVRARRICTFPP